MVMELFGPLRRLPSFSPVYRLKGMEIDKVGYRRAAREALGTSRQPRIRAAKVNERTAVFFSREDLTAGLVGYPCYGCIGYATGTPAKPGSAVKLMRNMVLFAQAAAAPAAAPAK